MKKVPKQGSSWKIRHVCLNLCEEFKGLRTPLICGAQFLQFPAESVHASCHSSTMMIILLHSLYTSLFPIYQAYIYYKNGYSMYVYIYIYDTFQIGVTTPNKESLWKPCFLVPCTTKDPQQPMAFSLHGKNASSSLAAPSQGSLSHHPGFGRQRKDDYPAHRNG